MSSPPPPPLDFLGRVESRRVLPPQGLQPGMEIGFSGRLRVPGAEGAAAFTFEATARDAGGYACAGRGVLFLPAGNAVATAWGVGRRSERAFHYEGGLLVASAVQALRELCATPWLFAYEQDLAGGEVRLWAQPWPFGCAGPFPSPLPTGESRC